MNPQVHEQTITVAGQTYAAGAFLKNSAEVHFVTTHYGQQLFTFLKDWFSDAEHINVRTSGSTGEPKPMQVEKSRMIQGAMLTRDFLGLQKSDTAMLCMPLDYIAGKMMVIRSLVAGLNLQLVTPCARPLEHMTEHLAFAAMTPMQVFNSLQNEPDRSRLMLIDQLIIGGGAVDAQMAQVLKNFPNKIYSTYGMTETLSHIAMRRLSGTQASERYYPFPCVKLSLVQSDQTLVIDAPLVAKETLYTSDIAHIFEDGSFKILGRKDNTINSGGIKIQAEVVETLLQPIIQGPFAITSVPDPEYGEIVVLAVEKEADEKRLSQTLHQTLPKYCAPKKIIVLQEIPLTETKKIKRADLKQQVLQKLNTP